MPKRPITAEILNEFIMVSDPQISPNGEWILFSHKSKETDGKFRTQLKAVSLIDNSIKHLTQSTNSAGTGRYSPNGETVAFVRQNEKKVNQIYALRLDGGEAVAVTDLTEGSISNLKWSPDGTKIAFLFRQQHEDFTIAAADERKNSGDPTPPRVIDTYWYRLDGDGFFMQQRYVLKVVELASNSDTTVFDQCPMGWINFDWMVDSQGFILTHPRRLTTSRSPDEDMIEKVLLDGTRTELIATMKGSKDTVAVSPNGEFVAFVGTEFDADPWSVKNKKLWILDLKTEECSCPMPEDICLATGINGDSKEGGTDPILWSIDSKAVYFQVGQRGAMQLGYIQVGQPGVVQLTGGNHIITLGNLCKTNEKFACMWQDAECLPEIAVYDLNSSKDAPTTLTSFNNALFETLEVRPVKEITISDFEYPLHGWMIESLLSDGEKRPAVIEVHGGPHMMYGWTYMHEFQVLAAAGYTVIYSNPRGSKGYGEEHCAAIRGSWGQSDWVDIDNLTKWLVSQPGVDSSRIAIMGGSYGGYMTNWAIGHSKAYKAAITDRCVSNLVSMAGNSDFPFRPRGYWDAEAFSSLENIKILWEASPIAYFDKVTTPTLVIHSEGDLRCNIEQSEQVFSALQMQGVPSKFIRYPLETSHGMSRGGPAKLRIHRLNSILEWYSKYL